MRVLAIVPIAVVVAFCARAHAQPAQPDIRARDAGFIGKDMPILEIDDCPAPPQLPLEQLREIGSEHFERGEVLYVQGDYKGAVRELVAAYCIMPFYTILKDIGQAYERELDYERAIAYLERFVMSVPEDAQRPNPCAADPQADKRNVIARIKVLQSLRAKILINTDPPDAKITLSNETGVHNRGVAGQELEVLGGRYQVLIERTGYHPVTQEVRVQIGKPYTMFVKLEPRKGWLRVRVLPANARVFLDQRQVGTGAFDVELPRGQYTVTAEAPDRVTVTRQVEVLAEGDTAVPLDLPARPQTGRRQFIGYAAVAGLAAGAGLASATGNEAITAVGAVAGGAGGFFGSYFLTPSDIPLGTSSLAITSSLIGGTLAGASSLLVTGNDTELTLGIGSGLLVGGVAGYFAGSRLNVSPGDAAVINSGALWGSIVGALFAGSFDATPRIGAGVVLSGLGMGTIGGVLMTRYFNVSRTRAALIDLGGIAGMAVGVAIENVVTQAATGGAGTERTVNFTLGGLATGLVLAGILTRNVDAPTLPKVTPVVSKTQAAGQATTTLGIGGVF